MGVLGPEGEESFVISRGDRLSERRLALDQLTLAVLGVVRIVTPGTISTLTTSDES